MECPEAQPFVSVLYDGEPVAAEAAEHISGCASCRQELRDYAAMGAELRLAGSRRAGIPPKPAWLSSTVTHGRFLSARSLTARVMVPRYALGLVAGVIIALSIGLNLIRAQTPVLWFQFQIYPADMPHAASLRTSAAKTDLREPQSWMLRAENTGGSPSLMRLPPPCLQLPPSSNFESLEGMENEYADLKEATSEVLRVLVRRFPPSIGAPARHGLEKDDPEVEAIMGKLKKELKQYLQQREPFNIALRWSKDTECPPLPGDLWREARPCTLRAYAARILDANCGVCSG